MRHITLQRRDFLGGMGAALAGGTPGRSAAGITLGAIRWDAWDATGSPVLARVEQELSPSQWHFRAPWFAKVLGPDRISIDGNHQEIMDAEIRYAHGAGLDYWAYCWYGDTLPAMQNAWCLHQSSRIGALMNWCMILQFSRMGGPKRFAAHTAEYLAYFREKNYQRVLTDRPLLFIYFEEGLHQLATSWCNSLALVGASLSKLSHAAAAAGAGVPYIVVMHGYPKDSASIQRAVSADAISNYMGAVDPRPAAPYSATVASVRQYWQDMVATGSQVVPICQTGWDVRTGLNTDQERGKQALASKIAVAYTLPGRPDEIATHITGAIDFVRARAQSCRSRSIVIYSWNECSEGGSTMEPSVGNTLAGGSILRAVASELGR